VEFIVFLPNSVPTVNGHSNKVRGRLASLTDPERDQEAVVKVTCTALLDWTILITPLVSSNSS
jgi:hypothetical protein